MTPEAITLLFKEATEAFTPIEGKPTDHNILAIRKSLLPLLMDIPYDHLGCIQFLTAIITNAATYMDDHGNAAFVQHTRVPLYNSSIPDNATTVVWVKLETAHTACISDYASFEAAELGVAKSLREVVDNLWINDLKDADTFYTKVSALQIVAHLDANSGSLHAINMLTLQSSMQSYYKIADGIPQYITLLEEA